MATIANRTYTSLTANTVYGGRQAPTLGQDLFSFTLENNDPGVHSRTLFRGGMPFAKGDIPPGYVPSVKRDGAPVAVQFDERSTWSDGSLKFAVMHLRDSDTAGAGSKTYTVAAATGSYNNTGATTLASVAAANDLAVEVSNLAQWDGTLSETRASGAARASFAEHAGVATRVTKIHSGSVCEGWVVWGMFKDGATGSGAEDAHLKAVWHVDVWKDASGAVIDTEFSCVLAQDWWAVPGKFRLDYSAALKRNGALVHNYAGIKHIYHAHWMTVRMQDDANHGKRHWVGTVPTLTYKFSKAYWKATKLVPPYDLDFVPGNPGAHSYVPLSTQKHRAHIDGTGGYIGRSMLSEPCARAFLLQTPAAVRDSRLSNFAGLHCPFHYRDERMRMRPGESADVANTLIPLLLNPKPPEASTFPGLPAPKDAYAGTEYQTVAERGGWVPIKGGEAPWASSGGTSHAVGYSTYAYLLEGEHYMLESVIDHATRTGQCGHSNQWGHKPYRWWYQQPNAITELGIPSGRYAGIPGLTTQERSMAFTMNIVAYAAALTPDSDPQGAYLRVWNAHINDYINDSMDYTPPSAWAAGLHFSSHKDMRSPWQNFLNIQGCYQNYRMTEQAASKRFAENAMRIIYGLHARSPYNLGIYHALVAPYNGDYSQDNQFHAARDFRNKSKIWTDGVTVKIEHYHPLVEGDVFYFTISNSGMLRIDMPPGAQEAKPYYVVGPLVHEQIYQSALQCCFFSLSETPGGPPVSFPLALYSCGFISTSATGITAPTGVDIGADNSGYLCIAQACYAFAEQEGAPGIVGGEAAAVRAFTSAVNYSQAAGWMCKP